jgi:hypothetical protein
MIAHPTYSQASLDLACQITDRYGSHPGVADLLTIRCMPVRNSVGGFALVAYPRGGIAHYDEVLVAYFGPAPAMARGRR